MISVTEARELAQKRLQAKLAEWSVNSPSASNDNAAVGADRTAVGNNGTDGNERTVNSGENVGTATASAPQWFLSLKPPAERTVLTNQANTEEWVSQWRSLKLPTGVTVEWEERSWRSLGRQSIPTRITFASAQAVALFGGGTPARQWQLLTARVGLLRKRFGDCPTLDAAVRRHLTTLLSYDSSTFTRFLDVVAWLTENPTTGYRPRQLPIRGVDSKWFGNHRGAVTSFFEAVTGSSNIGIVYSDTLIRVRILDRHLVTHGPYDFAAPILDLAQLDLEPQTLFVFENLESVLAMPPWPGAIVIHGTGYAVDTVASIPWVERHRIVYWGDLDSHGFNILHRLRSHHPHVDSILMDAETLFNHRDLLVAEPIPARGDFPTLTASEQATLDALRQEGNVRLEQERIPWEAALQALHRAAEEPPPACARSDGTRKSRR